MSGIAVCLQREPQFRNSEVDASHEPTVDEYLVLRNDLNTGGQDDGEEFIFEYRLEPGVGEAHRMTGSIDVLTAPGVFEFALQTREIYPPCAHRVCHDSGSQRRW